MSNDLFKLILIEEIKRMSIDSDIRTFYSSLSDIELKMQLICADATLSRGSLPLAEKYLRNMKPADIDRKLEELSDYNFYFTADKIYKHLINALQNSASKDKSALQLLKDMAVNGELDELIVDIKKPL